MSEPTAAVPVCYRHPDRETGIRCQRCERPICPDCMNSASVGFQCPSCIKEGAKSTRSGRLPYGGAMSIDARITTFVLIGLNVLVWLLIQADGGNGSSLVDKLAITPDFGFHSTGDGGATLYDGVASGAWWQVITSAFTHVTPLHIASNMLALYFIGPALESVLGRARFLTLYLVSGIAGSAGVMLFANEHQATLGASGAVFGLLGALAVVTFKIGGDWRNVLIWIALNLVLTFTLSNISWQGHLGGLAGGTLIGLGFVYAPKANRTVIQFAVAGAVLAVSLALILVRVAALPGIDGLLGR
ncbi:MAG: rhomboid family intramembrane serine protease [Marmoricola sp.]